MDEYTNLIKVNVPGTREEYESGNGEGCWVKVSDACKKAYDSDLGAPFGGECVLEFHGVLDNDSWAWPPLTAGNHIVFEMRGEDRPVVPIDWLIASCPACAAEKGLVRREDRPAPRLLESANEAKEASAELEPKERDGDFGRDPQER